MRLIIYNLKFQYLFPVLLAAGIIFAASSSNTQPLFQTLSDFVLFASEEINLDKETQISSGDLGSNKEISIDKDVIVSGNLFADKITLDKNIQINGNVSYNKLKTQKEAQILGQKTSPISLPVANLPEIPDFPVGAQDFKFEGQDNILAPGDYRDITLEKNSRLVLSGGLYNLRKLELKDSSTLIFNAPTTLNIQFKLKGQNKVSILPGQSLNPQDLVINYIGIKPKHEKQEKEDDDEEINNLLDDKEKKDHKEQKLGQPVVFGQNSFLNFKLLAPKANVHIGEDTTLRGNIWGRKVKVGKEAVLSIGISLIKEFDSAKVIIDSEKSIYPANEVIVNLTNDATIVEAQAIATLISGSIVGHISFANAYQIQVPAAAEVELDVIIEKIKSLNNPKIEGVFPNFLRSAEHDL